MILAWKEQGNRMVLNLNGYTFKQWRPKFSTLFILKASKHRLLKYLQHQLFFMLSASYHKGSVWLPNRMNFRKKFQTAFDPPSSSFLENYFANFLWQIWLHIREEVWWPDSMKCIHMISRDRVFVFPSGPTHVFKNNPKKFMRLF